VNIYLVLVSVENCCRPVVLERFGEPKQGEFRELVADAERNEKITVCLLNALSESVRRTIDPPPARISLSLDRVYRSSKFRVGKVLRSVQQDRELR
jgi:hypothetical protein